MSVKVKVKVKAKKFQNCKVMLLFLQFFQGSSGNVIDDYWVLKDVSKGVSRVFHGCIKVVTRVFQGGVKGFSSVCQECFKYVS